MARCCTGGCISRGRRAICARCSRSCSFASSGFFLRQSFLGSCLFGRGSCRCRCCSCSRCRVVCRCKISSWWCSQRGNSKARSHQSNSDLFHGDSSFPMSIDFTHCMHSAHALQSRNENGMNQANTCQHYKKCQKLARIHISKQVKAHAAPQRLHFDFFAHVVAGAG